MPSLIVPLYSRLYKNNLDFAYSYISKYEIINSLLTVIVSISYVDTVLCVMPKKQSPIYISLEIDIFQGQLTGISTSQPQMTSLICICTVHGRCEEL